MHLCSQIFIRTMLKLKNEGKTIVSQLMTTFSLIYIMYKNHRNKEWKKYLFMTLTPEIISLLALDTIFFFFSLIAFFLSLKILL